MAQQPQFEDLLGLQSDSYVIQPATNGQVKVKYEADEMNASADSLGDDRGDNGMPNFPGHQAIEVKSRQNLDQKDNALDLNDYKTHVDDDLMAMIGQAG